MKTWVAPSRRCWMRGHGLTTGTQQHHARSTGSPATPAFCLILAVNFISCMRPSTEMVETTTLPDSKQHGATIYIRLSSTPPVNPNTSLLARGLPPRYFLCELCADSRYIFLARRVWLCCLIQPMSSLNISLTTNLTSRFRNRRLTLCSSGIAQKNNKESSADGLKLRMVGQTKTTLVDRREEKSFSETKDFFSHDVQLASFGGKAASGVHSFPFSVMLPVGLPPSLMVWCDKGVFFPISTAHTHYGTLSSSTASPVCRCCHLW